MSQSWAKGSTRRWRVLRAQVLATNRTANRGRCNLAIPGVCTGRADTVHHTLGRAVTGDDPRHLEAVCAACNLHIGEPGRHEPAPKPKKVSSW